MKTFQVILITFLVGGGALTIQSQSKPSMNSGTALIQIKAANEALLSRQAATMEILKAVEADSNQLRIIAKKK